MENNNHSTTKNEKDALKQYLAKREDICRQLKYHENKSMEIKKNN